eukprot:CAMPEP_0202337518 /NCGR_PEP_ID=MMETSP1126-20121109/167_2 /ASSEMBLY_ACC=CAM_ASM_000457 /TAXON_ID=3047 /ORGANISM="Dunaliella tertiolecta, Strain CCMP1320" /LENGTH=173 /DNA_ID=CAMNT_0048927723 /DNA_START=469 /DNA_END=990 /DNA_ORIENTATION=-
MTASITSVLTRTPLSPITSSSSAACRGGSRPAVGDAPAAVLPALNAGEGVAAAYRRPSSHRALHPGHWRTARRNTRRTASGCPCCTSYLRYMSHNCGEVASCCVVAARSSSGLSRTTGGRPPNHTLAPPSKLTRLLQRCLACKGMGQEVGAGVGVHSSAHELLQPDIGMSAAF